MKRTFKNCLIKKEFLKNIATDKAVQFNYPPDKTKYFWLPKTSVKGTKQKNYEEYISITIDIDDFYTLWSCSNKKNIKRIKKGVISGKELIEKIELKEEVC